MNNCSICGKEEIEPNTFAFTLLYRSNIELYVCDNCLLNLNDEIYKKWSIKTRQSVAKPKLVLVVNNK